MPSLGKLELVCYKTCVPHLKMAIDFWSKQNTASGGIVNFIQKNIIISFIPFVSTSKNLIKIDADRIIWPSLVNAQQFLTFLTIQWQVLKLFNVWDFQKEYFYSSCQRWSNFETTSQFKIEMFNWFLIHYITQIATIETNK